MRKKKGFVMHKVCEQNIIIGEGKENIDFNNLVTINETAAFLWERMKDGDFSVEDMVNALCGEYDVDADTAARDCRELADKWLSAGIIEK